MGTSQTEQPPLNQNLLVYLMGWVGNRHSVKGRNVQDLSGERGETSQKSSICHSVSDQGILGCVVLHADVLQ